jgi:hypothetical protein
MNDSYRYRPDETDDRYIIVFRYGRFQRAEILRRREKTTGLWIRYGNRKAYLNPREVAHARIEARRHAEPRLFIW